MSLSGKEAKPQARDKFGSANRLTPEAWDERYRAKETAWELGRAAPPLARWLTANPPSGRVLVPGCGRGHEARLAAALGARWVLGLDLSALALKEARSLTPSSETRVAWALADVRRLPAAAERVFALVLEHTCFCALDPSDRAGYVDEVARVLKPGGLLVGLFYVDFDNPDGPPFGLPQPELRALLEGKFKVLTWESHPADSVERRAGREALVVARKT
jgi:SAM-dependent methyltransferase